MERSLRFVLALLLAVPSACALLPGDPSPARPAASSANSRSARVADTEAGSPLRKACPEFDRQIQRLLTRAWHRVNEPGEVRVRFVLRGSRIVEVQEGQGTYRYLRYVRQAIGELECDGGSGEDRTFDLIVTFVEVWPD